MDAAKYERYVNEIQEKVISEFPGRCQISWGYDRKGAAHLYLTFAGDSLSDEDQRKLDAIKSDLPSDARIEIEFGLGEQRLL